MPDNNYRPRYVTPPINPNGGTNPMQELDAMLGAPSVEAPAKPGLLETILSAVASGAGTFASNDPGQALLGQVAQLRQSREREKAMYQQEQMRRSAMRDQLAVNSVLDNMTEQRQIRAEQRGQEFKRQETKEEREFLVSQANNQYANQEKLTKINFANQEKLAKIEQQGRLDIVTLNNNFEQKKNELAILNKNIADQIELQGSYMMGGMDAGVAASIARKRVKDEPLTKQEEAALNKTFANIRAMKARASSGGSGGGGINEKALMQMVTGTLSDLRKNQMVELSDGSIIEASAIKMDAAGRPILAGQTIKRYLTQDESIALLGPKVLETSFALIRGEKPQGYGKTEGSPKATTALSLDDGIKEARKRGYNNQEVREWLGTMKGQFGEQAITDAIIRNKLVDKPAEKPKPATVKGKGLMGSYNRPF